LIQSDFQNKPDVAMAVAREWLDRQEVDLILDVPLSSAALAVADLVRQRDRAAIFIGPADSALTGRACSPNHLQWVFDTWSLAASTGRALVASGGDTWFFILADYAFGHALANDASRFVEQAGGRVLGRVAAPFPGTTDFSSFLLRAQGSRAKIIGLANGGSDTINCIKQAAEFGLAARGQRLAGLLFQLPDVKAVGLEAAQGLVLSEAFYWDLNEGTRSFAARFEPRMEGRKPSMLHAGAYSATLHYLKAVVSLGTEKAKASGKAVLDRMKDIPAEDIAYGRCTVRRDGRVIHPMYLFEVKAPGESRQPWDCYKLLRTVPADQAFRPMGEGGCTL
jgi:branched-chain amino acid transport system substrate-binding protein